jgi:Mg2+/citrate symporter
MTSENKSRFFPVLIKSLLLLLALSLFFHKRGRSSGVTEPDTTAMVHAGASIVKTPEKARQRKRTQKIVFDFFLVFAVLPNLCIFMLSSFFVVYFRPV